MHFDSLKRRLLAATLPITLLSACADRETPRPPDAEMPAAADTRPDADAAAEVARLRDAITLPDPRHVNASAPVADVQRTTRADVAARFAAAADAGNPEAAYVAGRSLAECHRILRDDTPEAMLSSHRDEMLELQQREGTPAYEHLQQQFEGRFARRVDGYVECSTLAPGLVARSVGWLEQAAAAGHPGARKAYPALAMAEFETREGIIRDPMEARRRQALARAYIEEAVAAGDQQALNVYVGAQHGRGPLYPEDRRALQVYGYVHQLALNQPRTADPTTDAVRARIERRRNELAGTPGEDRFQSLLRDGPFRAPSEAFSDAEWAEITAEGRRIFEDTFRTGAPDR